MFDIGFQELLLVAIVALLVLGPERLPQALRTLGLWLGRMRRSFNAVKNEIEREIGMDEIRQQLHNEAVMEELSRIERDTRASLNDAARPVTGSAGSSSGQAPDQLSGSATAPTAASGPANPMDDSAAAPTATPEPGQSVPQRADAVTSIAPPAPKAARQDA